MYDGEDARTLNEVITSITNSGSQFADQVDVISDDTSTIRLKAKTPGSAANNITYNTTGCFGVQTVQQGSTVSGKEATEKTNFVATVNGRRIDTSWNKVVINEDKMLDLEDRNYYVINGQYKLSFNAFTGDTLDYVNARIGINVTQSNKKVSSYIDVTNVTFLPPISVNDTLDTNTFYLFNVYGVAGLSGSNGIFVESYLKIPYQNS